MSRRWELSVVPVQCAPPLPRKQVPGVMERVILGSATTLLVSGGLGVAGLGAGTALAIPLGGGQWCPGDPPLYPQEMQQLAQLPGGLSVCQDYYTDTQSNFVAGDPGPGKPPNMFPLQQSSPPQPWMPPPGCPPWATIFSGPAECGGL